MSSVINILSVLSDVWTTPEEIKAAQSVLDDMLTMERNKATLEGYQEAYREIWQRVAD